MLETRQINLNKDKSVMDNAILFTACLLFGWLVMYAYGFKRGYKAGREDEQDATTRRYIMFRIERFGAPRYTTRFLNDNN